MATSNPSKSNYDRDACSAGIVHVGFGAFHRAHQAVYIDHYMEKTGDLAWGIHSINLRAAESDAFEQVISGIEKSGGYLLKTTNPENDRKYQLIRPHIAFSNWATQTQDAENALVPEAVKLVTITVTESGYYLDDKGKLNVDDPVISAELSNGKGKSLYAYLAIALKQRAEHTDLPLTISCCDNIRENGHMLEQNFHHYLALTKQNELLGWVKDNVSFPCSMVDRITPRLTDTVRNEIEDLFPGLGDSAVHAETFKQWVIEDKFASTIPDLTEAGVELVDNVFPYEEAKIRILNGGHTGLTYLGALAGYKTFDQTMKDKELRLHFNNFESQEVLPAIRLDLPFDKEEYLAVIASRFSNEAIADALERICMDGFTKMQIFVRPTLEGCFEHGIVPHHTLISIASWFVYARRFLQGNMPIEYIEPNWDKMRPMLEPGGENLMVESIDLWSDLPDRFTEFKPALLAAIQETETRWHSSFLSGLRAVANQHYFA